MMRVLIKEVKQTFSKIGLALLNNIFSLCKYRTEQTLSSGKGLLKEWTEHQKIDQNLWRTQNPLFFTQTQYFSFKGSQNLCIIIFKTWWMRKIWMVVIFGFPWPSFFFFFFFDSMEWSIYILRSPWFVVEIFVAAGCFLCQRC